MKKLKNVVVINESHTLLPEQEEILNREFPDGWELLKVPVSGWTLEEMDSVMDNARDWGNVIFISPVPYMLKTLSQWQGEDNGLGWTPKVRLFHNDRREKKELPNGRIVSVVAREGWQLV